MIPRWLPWFILVAAPASALLSWLLEDKAGWPNSAANTVASFALIGLIIAAILAPRTHWWKRLARRWHSRDIGVCSYESCETETISRCIVCKKHYCTKHAEAVNDFRGQIYMEIGIRAKLPLRDGSLICPHCISAIIGFIGDDEWVATR